MKVGDMVKFHNPKWEAAGQPMPQDYGIGLIEKEVLWVQGQKAFQVYWAGMSGRKSRLMGPDVLRVISN